MIHCKYCKQKFKSILTATQHICIAKKPKQVIRFNRRITSEDKAIRKLKKELYDRIKNG